MDDHYISVEPLHWGMFPVERKEPRQFVQYRSMPGLEDLISRNIPPRLHFTDLSA